MSAQASHYRWTERPTEQLRPGIARRFVTSERMMMGEVTLAKGKTVPPHSHENEQFTHVVKGALRFTFGPNAEDVVLVRAGEVVLIPSGLLHGVEALEDTLEYDVFTPPRQDWIDLESDFLRATS